MVVEGYQYILLAEICISWHESVQTIFLHGPEELETYATFGCIAMEFGKFWIILHQTNPMSGMQVPVDGYLGNTYKIPGQFGLLISNCRGICVHRWCHVTFCFFRTGT